MNKKMLLIFILMFSFTSCELLDQIQGKKDENKDNAPQIVDDPNNGLDDGLDNGLDNGNSLYKCIITMRMGGATLDAFCQSGSSMTAQICTVTASSFTGGMFDPIEDEFSEGECPTSITRESGGQDMPFQSHGYCDFGSGIVQRYYGNMQYGTAEGQESACVGGTWILN